MFFFCLFLLIIFCPASSVAFAAGSGFGIGVSVVSDATPPTTPAGLTASAISSSQINLSWTASTDNVAVTGYVVRRNGSTVASSSGTTYSDTGLAAGTTYNYTVQAFDATPNYSGVSATSSATTLSAPAPSDTTPPSVSSFSPANGATGVASTTALVMTMSESVNKFSGNVLVKRISDGGIAQTIDVASAQVSVAGAVVTMTLSAALSENAQYYVEIPGGAFADTAGNAFAGFSGSATWAFTTADTAAPIVSGVTATSTYTTGTVSFATNESAQATLLWGLDTSYAAGTMTEGGYGTSHALTITSLATGTTYYYRVTAKDASNNQSAPVTGVFATLAAPVAPDTTPPANPSAFTGNPALTSIALSWTNPNDADFVAVRIMRRGDDYPVSSSDGVLVYDGAGSSVTDSGLTSATRYYYTAFARDATGNYSSGAIYSGLTDAPTPPAPPPPPPGTPPPPPGSPSPGGATPPPSPGTPPDTTLEVVSPPAPILTGPFAETHPGATPNPLIAQLTLDEVIFTQLGGTEVRLMFQDGIVKTNGEQQLRVSIPYDRLPEVLKSIAISVQNGASGETSAYLLRVNAAKTSYDAVLPTFVQAGNYPFIISILDNERGVVTRLEGTLHVVIATKLPAFIPPFVAQAINNVVDAVREPVASAAPTVTSVGVAVGASQAVLLTTNVTSAYDLYLLLLKFVGLLTGLFRRRKNEPWGVVYDSVTKRPLDPAYVIAQMRTTQQSKGEAITDLDGRYGFILNPGEYHIVANKTHYKFPSESLKGRARDEFYENLYFGDSFHVREGGVVQYNIPLDPIEFDWNEFAKNQDKVFQVYSRKQNIRLWFFNALFFVGLLFSTFSLVITPTLLNGIVVAVYGMILGFQMFWRATHKITRIINKTTGLPIPFALVKVWYPGINTMVKKVVADEFGRFYFLVPPGTYYITVEAKQQDGTYKEVLRTEPRELKRGVVKDDFLV